MVGIQFYSLSRAKSVDVEDCTIRCYGRDG